MKDHDEAAIRALELAIAAIRAGKRKDAESYIETAVGLLAVDDEKERALEKIAGESGVSVHDLRRKLDDQRKLHSS